MQKTINKKTKETLLSEQNFYNTLVEIPQLTEFASIESFCRPSDNDDKNNLIEKEYKKYFEKAKVELIPDALRAYTLEKLIKKYSKENPSKDLTKDILFRFKLYGFNKGDYQDYLVSKSFGEYDKEETPSGIPYFENPALKGYLARTRIKDLAISTFKKNKEQREIMLATDKAVGKIFQDIDFSDTSVYEYLNSLKPEDLFPAIKELSEIDGSLKASPITPKGFSAKVILIGDKKYGYFLKDWSTNMTFTLNNAELLSIVFNDNFSNIINDFAYKYGMNRHNDLRQKYLDNIYFLENLESHKDTYPNIYKCLKTCTETLIILNNESIKSLSQDYTPIISTENYLGYREEMPLFLASMNHIRDTYWPDSNLGTVKARLSQKIKVAKILGVLNEIPSLTVNTEVLQRSVTQALKNKTKYIAAYYSIPSYKDKLDLIEERAAYLLNSGLSLFLHTKDEYKGFLDNYFNTISKEIIKNRDRYNKSRNRIEKEDLNYKYNSLQLNLYIVTTCVKTDFFKPDLRDCIEYLRNAYMEESMETIRQFTIETLKETEEDNEIDFVDWSGRKEVLKDLISIPDSLRPLIMTDPVYCALTFVEERFFNDEYLEVFANIRNINTMYMQIFSNTKLLDSDMVSKRLYQLDNFYKYPFSFTEKDSLNKIKKAFRDFKLLHFPQSSSEFYGNPLEIEEVGDMTDYFLGRKQAGLMFLNTERLRNYMYIGAGEDNLAPALLNYSNSVKQKLNEIGVLISKRSMRADITLFCGGYDKSLFNMPNKVLRRFDVSKERKKNSIWEKLDV